MGSAGRLGRVAGVSDDLRSLRGRREIIAAYIEVLARPADLLETCLSVAGDSRELGHAVQEEFGLSAIAADAVLSMQVRRFTPNELSKILDELTDVDLRLERISDE
jgi:DNA gyrase/topoisomerase IV subunit A